MNTPKQGPIGQIPSTTCILLHPYVRPICPSKHTIVKHTNTLSHTEHFITKPHFNSWFFWWSKCRCIPHCPLIGHCIDTLTLFVATSHFSGSLIYLSDVVFLIFLWVYLLNSEWSLNACAATRESSHFPSSSQFPVVDKFSYHRICLSFPFASLICLLICFIFIAFHCLRGAHTTSQESICLLVSAPVALTIRLKRKVLSVEFIISRMPSSE